MLRKLPFKGVSIKDLLTISFGTLIVAAAVYFFMQPSQVSIGSGAALASTAVNILNAYFTADEIGTAIIGEHQLIQ